MLNLGTLQFVLGVNTQALGAAANRIQSFGNAVSNVQQRANKGLETNISQMRKAENSVLSAVNKVSALTAKINSMKIAPDVKADAIKELNRELNNLTKGVIKSGKAADNTGIDRSMAKFANATAALNVKLQETAKLEKAAGDAAELAGRQAAAAAKKAASARSTQSSGLTSSIERARNLGTSVELSDIGGADKVRLMDQIQAAANRMRSALSGGQPLDPAAFTRAKNRYTSDIGEISRSFRHLKSESSAPKMENWKQFRANLQGLGSTMLLINGHLGGMSTRMFALGTIVSQAGVKLGILTAGLVGIGVGLKTLATGALTATLAIEKAELGLKAVMGTSAAASTQMGYLRKVTDIAGISFVEAGRGYARFLAASRASGQTLKQTQEQFTGISLVTGKLGLSVEDAAGTFKAFEQILSKGSVQAEELRGQLGDRLPGAYAIAATAMGKTTAELNKMTKAGDLASRDFVPKFVKALQVAYNVKADEPINTLQAAITRATNAVTLFYDAFAKNAQVAEAAKTVLAVFTKTLTYLEQNMSRIIIALGQISRALFASTAAWIVWRGVAAGGFIISVTSALYGMSKALITGTVATKGLAAATSFLNNTLGKMGIRQVLALFGRLTVSIGAAVVGYKLMDKWLGNVNEGFDDTAHIREYIEYQRKAGYQISQTTDELLRQAKAMNIADSAAAAKAGMDAANARSPRGIDRLQSMLSSMVGYDVPAQEIASQGSYAKDMEADAQAAVKKAQASASLYEQLQKIAKLPDLGGTDPSAGGDGSGSDKTKKAAEDNIDAIKSLIAAYDVLHAKTKVYALGLDAFDKVDAVEGVRQALSGLSNKELAMTNEALAKAGFTIGTVEERMLSMSLMTTKAAKSVEGFTNAWKAVNEAGQEIELLKAQIDDLWNTMATTDDVGFANLIKASEMLKDLDGAALIALKARIEALPLGINVASASMQDLALALAQVFNKVDGFNEAKDVIKDFNNTIADLAAQAELARLRVAGMNAGLGGDDLDLWVKRKQAVDYYTAALIAMGQSAEEVAIAIAKLNDAFDQKAEAEKIEKAAENWVNFKDSVARSTAEAVGAIAKDFRKIGDIVNNLLDKLLDAAIEALIIAPIFKAIKGFLGGIGGAANGGLVTSKGFADGGYVSGPGSSKSDSVPARLSNGEFVMSAAAVKRFGVSTLNAMNEGTGNASTGVTSIAAANSNAGPTRIEVIVTKSPLFDIMVGEIADQRIAGAAPTLIKGAVTATAAASRRKTITSRGR